MNAFFTNIMTARRGENRCARQKIQFLIKKKKNRFVLLHAYVFVEIYTIYIEKFNTNDFARVYVGERATV